MPAPEGNIYADIREACDHLDMVIREARVKLANHCSNTYAIEGPYGRVLISYDEQSNLKKHAQGIMDRLYGCA